MKGQEKSQTSQREEATLAFWKEHDIFKKTLEKPSPQGEFVFYEGPPTANNHPAIHHLEARAFKDLIPRYKTMRGFHVRRKAGWDTHGLPVELEVEKELGLKNKKEIESFGIEQFNKKCKESVLKYVDEWKEFTDRIGFWVDHNSTYFTFENSYIESVWNILKQVNERELLYKDYRVVPWCTRCGTPLSSHEVAEGYKDVTDTSVYVLFKITGKDEYIAAWTTTPWTLPGNVALAVGNDISYARITIEDGKKIWVAKERVHALFPDSVIEEEKMGADLVGWEYEPLTSYMESSMPENEKEKLKNAFKVYAADFVSTGDGTGIVHIAPMYGADDFNIGTKENLPKHHLVDEEGKFIESVTDFAGTFVKDTDKDIIAKLGDKAFRTEDVTHSYPFCWRCKTPLIYYARDSWYIRMSQLRDELIAENQKIHWEPEHIRDGRFGEWLNEVKDWAISRNRYWGTPLPVWFSESGKTITVGSIQELKEKTKRSGNRYFVMRHGETDFNTKGILNSDVKTKNDLTTRGIEQVAQSAEKLKVTPPTIVYASPFERTRQTALQVARTLNIAESSIIFDDRIQEFGFGDFNGKTIEEFYEWRKTHGYHDASQNGESYQDAKIRFGKFLYDLEQKHRGEIILVVTHGIGYESLNAVVHGVDAQTSATLLDDSSAKLTPGECREVNFAPLPVNENFELDLHRPYIDDVVLVDGGEEYKRVPEVLDVWFDSGAMPFAQDHYPFENKEWMDGDGYPADFISEAIDQTRGWFYTLHAIGVLMGKGAAYKNVISLGHLLDEKGKKMSKSLGNVVNPWDVIPKYGADALRYWMYTVNEPGASKSFDEKSVDEIVKKHINRLLNVLSFYNLFKDSVIHKASKESAHILDRWILARLNEMTKTVTENLDAYKVDRAARPLADFIDDLSTWYVRRSRDRIKGGDDTDKEQALGTLKYVLLEFSKTMAPFMPFVSENIYKEVSDGESVHLENWPEAQEADAELIEQMQKVRHVVSLGLEKRSSEEIKVRQPLSVLKINLPFDQDLLNIIAEEVNVEEVVVDSGIAEEVELDTNITPDLQKKGEVRDLLRTVQNLRKQKGLKPGESAVLRAPEGSRDLIENARADLSRSAHISEISFDSEGDFELV